MQCRFAGHLPFFYSVAQHSISVANKCSIKNKLAGLLHDASEAYLLDIPRPVKYRIQNYKSIEDHLMQIISEKFNFEYALNQEVHYCDNITLEIEWKELFLLKNSNHNKKLFTSKIEDVEFLFLKQFEIYSNI